MIVLTTGGFATRWLWPKGAPAKINGGTTAPLNDSAAITKHTEIPPLKRPIVDVPVAQLTPSERPISGALVKLIREGVSASRSDRLFDVTISNPSKEQILLKSFDLRWGYLHGFLLSVDKGEPLRPIAEYVLTIPIDAHEDFLSDLRRKGRKSLDDIDLEDYPHKATQVVYPPLVLPPANESGPSLTTFRLQLHYDFSGGRIDWHPSSDWNILFDLGVVDDSERRLSLLRNRGWRDLRKQD